MSGDNSPNRRKKKCIGIERKNKMQEQVNKDSGESEKWGTKENLSLSLYFDISKREPLCIKGYNQTRIGWNKVMFPVQ